SFEIAQPLPVTETLEMPTTSPPVLCTSTEPCDVIPVSTNPSESGTALTCAVPLASSCTEPMSHAPELTYSRWSTPLRPQLSPAPVAACGGGMDGVGPPLSAGSSSV